VKAQRKDFCKYESTMEFYEINEHFIIIHLSSSIFSQSASWELSRVIYPFPASPLAFYLPAHFTEVKFHFK
jgi:hypothetical protein